MNPPNFPVCCIVQPKGGVGKTTLAFTLALHAAETLGLKVLVIDTDASANLTRLLLDPESPKPRYELRDVYLANTQQEAASIQPTPINITDHLRITTPGARIDLMPQLSNIDFVDKASGLSELLKLHAWVSGLEYDLAVIDTPGWISNLAVTALVASSHRLSPLEPSQFSTGEIPTIEKLADTINSTVRVAKPIKNIGYLPYAASSKTIRYAEFMDALAGNGLTEQLLDTDLRIEAREAVARAIEKRLPPWKLKPKTRGSIAATTNYRAVLDTVLRHMELI